MAFEYRPRNADAWDKRANQSGGDFQGFVREDIKLFKPKKTNSIRILPPTFDDADHYGYDVFVHYGVGPNNASVLCLNSMKKQACPICEARAKALKLGEEEEARELKASKRVLMYLIDRDDEDLGPLIWAAPFSVDREFSMQAKDKRTGKILALDHPYEGYDIFFDRTGEGMTSKYVGVQVARQPSEVDEDHLEYIQTRPLPDMLIWRTYQEVLDLYRGGSDDPASPPASTPPRRGGAAQATPELDDEIPEQPVSRRRTVNGSRAQADEPSTRSRHQEPEEEAPRTRAKAAVNGEDAPWTEDDEKPLPEPTHQMSTAERLKSRYRKN